MLSKYHKEIMLKKPEFILIKDHLYQIYKDSSLICVQFKCFQTGLAPIRCTVYYALDP